jgi:hypothetical protein
MSDTASAYQDGYNTGKSGGMAKCLVDPDDDAAYQQGYQAGVKDAQAYTGPTIRQSTPEEIEAGERRKKLLEDIEAKQNAQEVLDELGNDPAVLEDAEIKEAIAQWYELQQLVDEREGIVPEAEVEAE